MIAKSPIIYNGKKEKLIKYISPLYPNVINNYYEPFCGGASIFFDIHNKQIINGDYYISDLNRRILRIYEVIRDDLSGLLNELKIQCPNALKIDITFVSNANSHANSLKGKQKTTAIAAMKNSPQWLRLNKELETYYYHIRAVEDSYAVRESVINRIGKYNNSYLTKIPKTKLELAAKDLFLNRMSMNGWRENKGKFNLSYFKERTNTPTFYNQPNILTACSKVFNDPHVHIKVDDYLNIEPNLVPGDLVYLDPPYKPASSTASFTNYTYPFNQKEQQDLADFVNRIDAKGVKFILSNSAIAQSLYSNNPKFNIIPTIVKQYSNGKQPDRREILVHN